jgi:catechol 2,3-dioxygenase-like lactoylglutathione lyase family enzyme
MIRGVKFISIPVSDQDRALAFYTGNLGFRLLTDQPFSDEQRWIELGISGADTRIILFQFGDDLKPGGQMNVTFWADDVAGTVRHLKSKGVTITMEPQHTEMGHGGGFSRLDRVRSIL